MQPRNNVLAIFHRERRHAIDGQIDAHVRAIQLSDAQQIGFQIQSIQLRAQIVAQKTNTQSILLRKSLYAKLLYLIKPLLQMRPPLLPSRLREIRPPVVILMTPHRSSELRLVPQLLSKILREELGQISGGSLGHCERPDQANRDKYTRNWQQMRFLEFDHRFPNSILASVLKALLLLSDFYLLHSPTHSCYF